MCAAPSRSPPALRPCTSTRPSPPDRQRVENSGSTARATARAKRIARSIADPVASRVEHRPEDPSALAPTRGFGGGGCGGWGLGRSRHWPTTPGIGPGHSSLSGRPARRPACRRSIRRRRRNRRLLGAGGFVSSSSMSERVLLCPEGYNVSEFGESGVEFR
ncbi:uncharacterized protein A4U43_C03F20320 [Asparagus officinalis]|uniref:Uncharacterized protein n=1 Tax=Asparagus officinalis TaxID=4686 RepID=A0A5P1FEE9_ASPOF|nr:uncharacterized protein A4U43_C03F20320 [Asparagus officinalis]